EWVETGLPDARPNIVALRECIGLSPERISAQLVAAREFLEHRRQVPRGLSPHAPYSVHPDLLRDLVDLSREHRSTVAMHLAEPPEGRQLLGDKRGPFVEFLKRVGVWRDDVFGGRETLDVLRELSRAPRALVVHGNDLSPPELVFVAVRENLSVVYCPRTHG